MCSYQIYDTTRVAQTNVLLIQYYIPSSECKFTHLQVVENMSIIAHLRASTCLNALIRMYKTS